MQGVTYSQNLFDTDSTEVTFQNVLIGSLQPEGDKIIARPSNGKALPFDAKEAAVMYLIRQNSQGKQTERKVSNHPTLF